MAADTLPSGGNNVLDLLHGGTPPLSALARAAGWRDILGFGRRNAESRFAFIVTCQVRAVEAERQGRWQRASFYWNELWDALRRALSEDECWIAGARNAGHVLPADSPAGFRAAFVRQITIAAHVGLFHAQVESGFSPLARPSVHLDGFARAASTEPLDIDDEGALVNGIAAAGLHAIGDRHSDAEEFCLALLRRFPSQSQLVDVALAQSHSRLVTDLDGVTAEGKKSIVEEHLWRISPLNGSYHDRYATFELLGLLHHYHSVALAELGEFPDALLAAVKAEAFAGSQPAVRDVRAELQNIVAHLKTRGAELDAERKAKGLVLNEKGLKLMQMAQTGDTPANEWSEGHAGHVRRQREQARIASVRQFDAISISTVPLIETSSKRGDADLRDVLASPSGLRLRLQCSAAIILGIAAAGLTVSDIRAAAATQAATVKIEDARRSGDDQRTLQALSELFDAGSAGIEPTEQAFAPIYREIFTRWFTARQDPLTEQDHEVVRNYRRQIVDHGLDPAEVAQ